jgi:hypothetical protein
MRAPVPAALPGAAHAVQRHVGIIPSTMACLGEMCAPKAPPASPGPPVHAHLVHQEPRAPHRGADLASWIARMSPLRDA